MVKLLISVLLSRLDSTYEDAILLCKEIFYETKVFTNNDVEIILPDISVVASEFNAPNDSTMSVHPAENSLNSKDIGHHNEVAGDNIDVDENKSTGSLEHMVTTPEHTVDRHSCTSVTANNKQTQVSGNEHDVKLELDRGTTGSKLFKDCKQEDLNINKDLGQGGDINSTYSVHKSQKVPLLAKRKYEILKRRNAEVKTFSEENELKMVVQPAEDNTYIGNESDTAVFPVFPVSVQSNISMEESIRKSDIIEDNSLSRTDTHAVSTMVYYTP